MATPKSKPPVENSPNVPEQVSRAYEERTNRNSNCTWIFEVDYAINSRKPRLFIFNVDTRDFYMYKCAHGSGGKNATPHDGKCREVSNLNNSHCSSLGVLETGANIDSDHVGQAIKLEGLSPTNSKNMERAILIHGAPYVSDNASNTDDSVCGRSWGCIAVADQYINKENGGELIQWLKDGSIGVAHYAGKFKI